MAGLLAHEWIEPTGGAEKVLDAWASLFPDAHIACLWDDDPGRYPESSVTESFIARSPFRGRKATALPLMAWHWRSYDLSEFDWALVSSHSFAHHIAVAGDRSDTPVFVYAHTPPRYLWAPELDIRATNGIGRLISPALRRLDRTAVRGSANYAANSHYIRNRMRRAWGVTAEVIYPPVDITRFSTIQDLTSEDQAVLNSLPDSFILGASRFVVHKRLESVLEFGNAANTPVVICGRGPDEAALRSTAARMSVPVTFVISPSDALLSAIMKRADVFVFPPVEDFGIMPIEAMAAGTPTIVNKIGGAAESAALTAGGLSLSFDRYAFDNAPSLLRQAKDRDMNEVKNRLDIFSESTFERAITSWMGGVS